ncbi:anillin-like isoform X2 [Belonocnema kinseyi]|uniref:anillin-like isoform X2 n=1 Tax=Belonocnema kinseyi TaxID=2817044 RepID=UPI00143DB6A9|nr:anillin-like isoform X2 [Belonocnema kinseyi]
MDPFTQRMLERARARREKLDAQLSNAGHDVKRRRSPLKDANAILAQVPAITQQIVSKTPKKSSSSSSISSSKSSPSSVSPVKTRKSSPLTSPVKATRKSSPLKKQESTKENGENPASNVRSKLQRLGTLYSDRELSSPIHRTEEKFMTEEESAEQKSAKCGARLNRLAALASTINNWEDDLSHPTLIKPTISKAEKIQAKLNEQVRNADPQPGTSGVRNLTRSNSRSPTKQLKWDKAVLETLEAQGFSRTKSSSRLVYDYKDCSQESSSPQGSPKKREGFPEIVGATHKAEEQSTITKSNNSPMKSNNSPIKCDSNTYKITTVKTSSVGGGPSGSSRFNENVSKSPEKKDTNSSVSSSRLMSRYGFNGSPKSPMKQSPGSVLSKASLFEKNNSTYVKVKDPAEMTLSERMALFERNKGEAPIPKAPLTMSVPTKMLMEKEKPSGDYRPKADVTGRAVSQQRNIYEHGYTQELENNILHSIQAERQKELEMLRTRFNRNKEVATVAAGCALRTSESSEGKSVSPKNSPICPVKPTPAPQDHVPPPPPLPQDTGRRSSPNKNTPVKRQVSGLTQSQEPRTVDDIKRVRVCAPKFGNLYPDLTGVEASTTDSETEFTVGSTEPETATLEEPTETETETEADYYLRDDGTGDYSDEDGESEDIGNTSLGRSILHVVNQQSSLNKKRAIYHDLDSTTSDISVLEEMDDYLDECLAVQDAQEGPTPPKLNRGGKSPSATSTSFKYSQGSSYRSPIKINSPASASKKEPYVIEGDSCAPLMHSVSFYRRQQSQTPKTPVRLISRIPDNSISPGSPSPVDEKEEAALVVEKVKRLVEEVGKQETTIGQASQALNLCNSTVEFSGSREQVEGERLLLLATHRRQAAIQELQRLKVQGTLKPVVPGSPEFQENGSLTVSAITLPLKRENFRNLDPDTRLHFVCLVRHMENVVSTPVVQTESGDSCVRFPSTLKIEDLYSDFQIKIEVYSLQTRAEVLPHEIKYHIHNNGSSSSGSKKPGGKTPKKFLKHDSKLLRPTVQSPAGPSAVRSPAFSLAGFVVFSLREVHRQQFTLNNVPQNSPLEGRLQMHVSCELSVSVEHRGFLTMFEDVSGFGAWHRRWCLLKGDTLSYWKYPDDERKKTPIGSLDLQGITTANVGLVSRDICARLNTFLLETVRPSQPGDVDSLVMVRNGASTTVRHLLSADTKEDRLEWCSKLNKTIHLIRAWGGTSALC